MDGERVLTLPKKTESTVSVELTPEERRVYAVAEAEVRRQWRQIASMGEHAVAAEYLLCMSLLQPLRRRAWPPCCPLLLGELGASCRVRPLHQKVTADIEQTTKVESSLRSDKLHSNNETKLTLGLPLTSSPVPRAASAAEAS